MRPSCAYPRPEELSGQVLDHVDPRFGCGSGTTVNHARILVHAVDQNHPANGGGILFGKHPDNEATVRLSDKDERRFAAGFFKQDLKFASHLPQRPRSRA
jgi:hypothetical protein